MAEYTPFPSGDISTTDFRVFAKQDGKFVSYFHDVPLYANEEKTILNMVVEIPRGTNAKMEISVNEEGNPIKQDVKNGALRFVHDISPYRGYIWNYGALPQTWEDPTHKHPETGCFGDCDPLDACEIGTAVGFRGQIKQVKPLGVIALIDEGETDWKVIVIDVTDPRADEFNDISDVQRLLPGFTMATYEWFRTYKIPAGKPANDFAFNGEAKGREYTLQVIAENYAFWQRLVSATIPPKHEKYEVACATTLVEGPYKVDSLNVVPKDVVAVADEAVEDVAEESPSVKLFVEKLQRAHPHGTAELSTVVQSLAVASREAAQSGLEGVANVLKQQSLAAIFHDTEKVFESSENGHYSVFYQAKDGLITFGVYQKSTPHRNEFSLADQVTAAGYDLVAAAFAKEGKFTFTTGYAPVTTSVSGVVATDSVPAAAGSESLLAVVAPLAFFQGL